MLSDAEASPHPDAGPSSPPDASASAHDASANDAGTPDGGRRDDGGAVASDAGSSDAGSSDAAMHTSDAGSASGCAATASWDPAWAAFEDQVLQLTNQARAAGQDCGSEGTFAATTPLASNAPLRCAARLYAKDMADTDNFAHDGTDGSTVTSRIEAAGYQPMHTWGENIAMGQTTPAQVVSGWLASDGHCRNIMDPSFKDIGIGYYPQQVGARTTPYWTQDFGG